MGKDKPIKWLDQIAHGGIAFLMTIMSAIPLLASINAFVWSVTREYYQAKITMIEVYRIQDINGVPSFMTVIRRLDFFKRDLVAAYVGIAVGLIAGIFLIFYIIADGIF